MEEKSMYLCITIQHEEHVVNVFGDVRLRRKVCNFRVDSVCYLKHVYWFLWHLNELKVSGAHEMG
jgi:hypothetical protein